MGKRHPWKTHMGQPTHHQPPPSSYLFEGLQRGWAYTFNPQTQTPVIIVVAQYIAPLMAGEGSLNRMWETRKHTNTTTLAHRHTFSSPITRSCICAVWFLLIFLFKTLDVLYQECVHEKQTAHLQDSLGRSTSRDTHCAKMYFTNKSVQITWG